MFQLNFCGLNIYTADELTKKKISRPHERVFKISLHVLFQSTFGRSSPQKIQPVFIISR